ncbi:hypothetical protein [Sandaracinus amylolyticus]|uniref:Lipoprotein n=1 Tax=Sandaracinus amylolyticus TaxID=927083 RepID=A0A0F6YIW9_9BACT|nr:hypothetical protein [Sandaracinus amylolyticus]AKF06653.1 hypothetical protein DB32_003802 [Sandaracinus amylolyticus]
MRGLWIVLAPLIASCGASSTRIATPHTASFPTELHGFRFGMNVDEAHAACAGEWHATDVMAADPAHGLPRARSAFCTPPLREWSIDLDLRGDPERLAVIGETRSGSDAADARGALDTARRELEASYGAPTRVRRGAYYEWEIEGGRIALVRHAPSPCGLAPGWAISVVYEPSR